MSDFDQIANLGVALAALWFVLIGFAVVLQRRDWAAAIARWPFVASLRFVRWAIGGAFVALGNWIRGRPQGGQRQDRRRH